MGCECAIDCTAFPGAGSMVVTVTVREGILEITLPNTLCYAECVIIPPGSALSVLLRDPLFCFGLMGSWAPLLGVRFKR